MPAVGAATSWLNDSPVVEPLRLRRVPLLTACACLRPRRPPRPPLATHPPPRRRHAPALRALARSASAAPHASPSSPSTRSGSPSAAGARRSQPAHPPTTALHHLRRRPQPRRARHRRPRPHPPARRRTTRRTPPSNPTPGTPTPTPPPTRSPSTSTSSPSNTSPPTLSIMQPIAGGIRFTLNGPPLTLHCGDTHRRPAPPPHPRRLPRSRRLVLRRLAPRRRHRRHRASAKSSRVQITPRRDTRTLRCRIFAAQAWASNRLAAFTTSAANRHLPPASASPPKTPPCSTPCSSATAPTSPTTLRIGFERTGTFHLFVVSGLHVALLAGGLFWLLRRLRLPQGLAVLLTIARQPSPTPRSPASASPPSAPCS